MAKVDPTAAVVTPALTALKASLAAGYGSGATTTHHREVVLQFLGIATADPRLAPNAVFDPAATYSKFGARGIELAQMNYVKFLHDPLNRIALTKDSSNAQSKGVITLPADREAAAREMIVDCVDMMLAYVEDAQYSAIWAIPVEDYEPTWVDRNQDGIPDDDQAPMNIIRPTIEYDEDSRTAEIVGATWTGSPDQFSYVWYLDGNVIDGAVSDEYTVPDTDAGELTARMVATNSHGDSKPAYANLIIVTADGS